MGQSKYIYGVINTHEEKNFDPIENVQIRKVYSIPYQDIACVVSDYPIDSFNYGTREEVAKKLICHQTVLEKIMEDYTIIPIKFGTLLNDRNEVKRVLEKGYSEFKERIKELDNKIELDVIALWNDLNSVIKKIGEEDEEIRNFKEEIAKNKLHDTYQERVKIGIMIKDCLDQKRNKLQSEMLEFLKEKARIDKLKEHELIDDRMILNCAFLLDKEKESELDQIINILNEKYREMINFKCVGPLPLYSFATYEVKKADFEAIEKARKHLGLSEEVDFSAIKEAYRKFIIEKHPDKFPNDTAAQKRFEEIQAVYKMLFDYCQSEKKSLKKEDIQDTYIISTFNIGV